MEELYNYIQTLYHKLYDQIVNEIFTQVGLIQLGILLLVIVISYYLTRLLRKYINIVADKNKKIIPILTHFSSFLLPIFFFIIASIAQFAMQKIGWNYLIFNIFATYFAVRIINKMLTIIFNDEFWLDPVKYFIWLMAFLNVLNLLDVTIRALDKIGFDYGEMHFSLLLLIKSLLTFLLALWITSKIADLIQHNITKSKRLNASVKILLNKTIKIVLLIIAMLIAMNIIGVKLTALTVLGGAIGVGIGFGLQKIFSNFISGFILLMDKAIKPGDVIEIDDTFGVIQSLSTRYVTLLTIEEKEHLIPNEDLITHKVINWSHSNRMIRLSVDVGVAYNTDIPLAMELITEAAKKLNRVYKFRQPKALIKDFGTSSIDLSITFWIKDPELGIDNIQSEVRLEIWKTFKEHNIQIPFPQSDVYIKSLPESNKNNIGLPAE